MRDILPELTDLIERGEAFALSTVVRTWSSSPRPVGAAMTVGLILAVLALIISAVVWGYGANSSNPHLASRGKVGVLVSCGAAIICGASVTLVNFFWNVGQSV